MVAISARRAFFDFLAVVQQIAAAVEFGLGGGLGHQRVGRLAPDEGLNQRALGVQLDLAQLHLGLGNRRLLGGDLSAGALKAIVTQNRKPSLVLIACEDRTAQHERQLVEFNLAARFRDGFETGPDRLGAVGVSRFGVLAGAGG